MCSRCTELQERVEELEEELGYAMSLPARIFTAFREQKLSASHSHILAILYRAKGYTSNNELDERTPIVQRNGVADPMGEYRTANGMSVHIWKLRKMFGTGFIESRRGQMGGYRLSEQARERIRQALVE